MRFSREWFEMPELIVAVLTALIAALASIIVAAINVMGNRRARERDEKAKEREAKLVEYQNKLDEVEREREESQKKRDEETYRRFEAMEMGIRSLLRNEIIKTHSKCMSQGWASLEDKEFMERNYQAYHGNGGNGIGTTLFDEVMSLPTKGKGVSAYD